MLRNDFIELEIEDMSGEGLGIGHAGGMAVFVKDTVVGDYVRAKAVKVKKTYAYARLEEVLKPSPDRVPARCKAARPCGGCQLQEMRYEAQLAWKQRSVQEQLKRIGGFLDEEVTVLPVLGMKDPWNYRNKAQFPVGPGKPDNEDRKQKSGQERQPRARAGFYAGRTHTIIDNHQCDIGIDANRYILEAVLRYMEECAVPAYEETTGTGLIRHVMTRAGFATGRLMVVIVAAAGKLPDEDRLVQLLREAAGAAPGAGSESGPWDLAGIVLNTNRGRTNVILGRKSRVLYGKEFIEDRIGSLTFRISPLSFYQVNPLQTKVLYETALSCAGLTGKETVWDLYCGIGTISLFLAKSAGRVIGVEEVPDAIRNAQENAALNHIDNCQFIVGKAEEVLTEREDLPKPEVVVVDPPRKGLDPAVIKALLSAAPERIVYVSCAPATLARDLRLFADGGYLVRKVQPVDMFPHTIHIETIVLLQKLNS